MSSKIRFFIFTYFVIFVSLMLYMVPFVLNSQLYKNLIQDISYIFILLFIKYKYSLKLSNILKNKVFTYIVLSFFMLTLLNILEVYYSVSKIDINFFRELRIFMYFMITLVFLSSFSNKVIFQNFEQFIFFILLASFLGDLFYLVIGKIFVPSLDAYIQLAGAQDENFSNAFLLIARDKFKIQPYLVTFLISFCLLKVSSVNANKKSLYLILMLIIIVFSLLSNMRSAILGLFVAILFSSFRVLFLGNNIKKFNLRYIFIVLIIALFIATFGFEYLLDNYEQFGRHVYNRRMEFGDRQLALLEVLNSDISILGSGFGSGFMYYNLSNFSFNPIDSALLNIVKTHGYLFLIVYISLLVFILKIAIKIFFDQNASIIGVSSTIAYFMLFFTHYNDSHFLFIPDSIIAAIIMGHLIIYQNLFKKRRINY